MPLGALLESWLLPVLVLPFVFGAIAGAVGGGLAFARAKERLWQRLVLGAIAGALAGWVAVQRADTITQFVFCCIVGGYAGADGISILLKAIGRGK
jgi:heme O synthase-like polyprenyltransferase